MIFSPFRIDKIEIFATYFCLITKMISNLYFRLPAHFQLAETAHSRVGRSYSPIQHHAKEYPSPPIHHHDVDLGEVRVVGPHEHLTGNDL